MTHYYTDFYQWMLHLPDVVYLAFYAVLFGTLALSAWLRTRRPRSHG